MQNIVVEIMDSNIVVNVKVIGKLLRKMLIFVMKLLNLVDLVVEHRILVGLFWLLLFF